MDVLRLWQAAAQFDPTRGRFAAARLGPRRQRATACCPGFLEHAIGLILLSRRGGGGYEFVHRTLLDHFADLLADGPPWAADLHEQSELGA